MNQIINKILDRSILLITIIAVPINISAFILLTGHPLQFFRLFNLLLGISILMLFIFRKKLDINVKTSLLIALVLLRGFYALCFGLLNIAGLWFVLAIIFSLLILTGKRAFYIYLATLFLTITTGILMVAHFPYIHIQRGFLKYGYVQISVHILHFMLIGYLAYYIISNFIQNERREAEKKRKLNERYLNAIITTQETERKRIAEDLHDGLSPALSAAKLYFQAYQDSRHPEEKATIAEKLNAILKNTIRNVTQIAHNTSPELLSQYGLKSAIEELINSNDFVTDINFNLKSDDLPRFDKNIELPIYRILTELISNTQKHAEAKNITITIELNNNRLIIIYEDDGIGFDMNETSSKGMGLPNIRNRINALKGSITFKAKEQSGVNIKMDIPIMIFHQQDIKK